MTQPDDITSQLIGRGAVLLDHLNDPVDFSRDSSHHTLGNAPTQASPGDHAHLGDNVSKAIGIVRVVSNLINYFRQPGTSVGVQVEPDGNDTQIVIYRTSDGSVAYRIKSSGIFEIGVGTGLKFVPGAGFWASTASSVNVLDSTFTNLIPSASAYVSGFTYLGPGTPGVWRCDRAGFYRLTALNSYASNATSFRLVDIMKNDTGTHNGAIILRAEQPGMAGVQNDARGTDYASLAVNDTLSLYAFQNSGVTLATTGWFAAELVNG